MPGNKVMTPQANRPLPRVAIFMAGRRRRSGGGGGKGTWPWEWFENMYDIFMHKDDAPMIKSLPGAVIISIMLTVLVSPEARSQDWNYFGACYSDDAILARDGKFFVTSCMGLGCKNDWEYGGTYRTLTDGVIEIYWRDEKGHRQSSTYTHRRLFSVKCRR